MLFVVEVYAQIAMPDKTSEQVEGIFDIKAVSHRHAHIKGKKLAQKMAAERYDLSDLFGRDGKPYIKAYGTSILTGERAERYCETRRKAI